jgi:hypothetical protein
MKTYGGVELYIHHSWLAQWMEVIDKLHAPGALLPRKSYPVPIG